ncbi:hypothetical protein MMC21_005067 [Puttea exsequens]|nr:hypothetical protein [Puttea exsequens]
MNGSNTALIDPTEEALSSSRLLGLSLGSLSSPCRKSSEISKAHREASNLFLTRRLPEALSIIEPLITCLPQFEDVNEEEHQPHSAPVAIASRKDRIKVWSFYLTLLNAIADLGPEEGKDTFGNRQWTSLVAKAKDGTIWEELVKDGYHGIEENVDPEVVINLVTLLLGQAQNQNLAQQRLETYLDAANHPNLDLSDHPSSKDLLNNQTNGITHQNIGTETLRGLSTRVKLIELFTLHVLPRNGEWDYAKGFIINSEVLDQEIRESFLQALQDLEDKDTGAPDQFQDAIPDQGDLAPQDPSPLEESGRESTETIRQQPPFNSRGPNSEIDYGIDKAAAGLSKAQSPSAKPSLKPTRFSQSKSTRASPSTRPRKPPNNGLYKRSVALMTAVQHMTSKMTEHIAQNPMGLLRFVLFLLGFIAAISRRDVKDRLGAGWDKVRRTIGMGVKVSYI